MSSGDYTCDFPGIVQTDETCFRFTNKSNENSANERLLFSNYWREQINLYGVKVSYFVNRYNTLSGDNFYGEDPNRSFADPVDLVIAVTLNEDAITLSRFGFDSDDAITGYIHISSFESTFENLSSFDLSASNIENLPVEPKAGDVFQLSEYGDDRPASRQAKYFEVTEKLDQDIAEMNQLGGHYVFKIRAKRLDYSFEPNVPFPMSSGNAQIFEGAGKIVTTNGVLNEEITVSGFTGANVILNGIYQGDTVGGYTQTSPANGGTIERDDTPNAGGEGITNYFWKVVNTNVGSSGVVNTNAIDRDTNVNEAILPPYNSRFTMSGGVTLVKIGQVLDASSQAKQPDYDDYDINSVSQEDVFDMDNNPDDVYGDYY